MTGELAFPSDSSDDPEEYDEAEMAGPEALLFKHAGPWPHAREDSAHTLAVKTACPVCLARGWLYIIP